MKFKVHQKSSTEPFESAGNDVRIQNVDAHKTVGMLLETNDSQALNAKWEFRFASKRFSASDFEALEVSGTPRGDQETLKEVSKSSQVTIHRACQVIMSSPEALPDIDPAAAGL